MRHLRSLIWVALALCMLGAPALAGDVSFLGAGAESTSGATCTPTDNTSSDTTGIGDHKWVSRNCSASTDQGFGWHLNYPGDASTSGTPFDPFVWFTCSDTGGGDIVYQVDMACCANGGTCNDLTYGTAQSVTIASCGGTANSSVKVSSPATNIAPSSLATNTFCFYRVMRDADNVADTYGGTVNFIAGRLNYP